MTMDQSSLDPQTIQQNIRLCLVSSIATDRAPADFDNSLRSACQLVANKSGNLNLIELAESIFLQEGLLNWFAFFCATTRKCVDKQVFIHFTPDVIHRIAKTVSATKPDASVVNLFKHLFWKAKRSPERRRYLQSAGISFSSLLLPLDADSAIHPESTNDSLAYPTSKRRRTESTDFSKDMGASNAIGSQTGQGIDEWSRTHVLRGEPWSCTATQVQNGTIPAARKFTWPETPPYGDYFDGDPAYQFRWPKATRLPTVFPPDLCDLIVKVDGLAAVMVEFPVYPSGARLVLYVEADHIAYVVSKLFDQRVVSQSGRRTVVMENGPTMEIHGSLSLSRAQRQAVDSFFGESACLAYTSSELYQRDVSNGSRLIHCLTMTVQGDPGLPCSLQLMSGVGNLEVIRSFLWQPEDRPTDQVIT